MEIRLLLNFVYDLGHNLIYPTAWVIVLYIFAMNMVTWVWLNIWKTKGLIEKCKILEVGWLMKDLIKRNIVPKEKSSCKKLKKLIY